jgi:FKBP-type peptidyl-prolyl cis-trans isomerase 2
VTIDARSEADEPLIYIHGQGDIVPGLEKVLSSWAAS